MKKKYFAFDKNLNLKEGVYIQKKEKKDNSRYLVLAKYSSIGYYLVTPVIIGVFLGLYLDGRFGTDYLVVIGIIIGSIGSIYNLFKLLKY